MVCESIMKKQVTIYDIAKKLNVSPATVTRAMNGIPKVSDEKRQLILNTAKEMGYEANRVAVSLARKPLKIAFVVFGAIAEFYQRLLDGVDFIFPQYRDFNVVLEKYVLDTKTSTDSDLIQILHSEEIQSCDGIVLYSVHDTAEIAASVDGLIRRGVLIHTVNTDVTSLYTHYTLATNGRVSGKRAAELLDWTVTSRNICHFMGERNTNALRDNNLAFSEACAERKLNIVANFYDDGNAETAIKYLKDVLCNQKCLGGVYINSAVSDEIVTRIVEEGLLRGYRIVTSDLSDRIAEYIRKDIVIGTIFQDPFKQGKDAFERTYAVLADHKELEMTQKILPILISKSNLQEYLDR